MKKWAALFGIVLIAVTVLADRGQLGFLGRFYDFPYGDKVGHFSLFGLLSLLVNLAVFEAWPKRDRLPLALRASVVLGVLIGLEEYSQRWFPTRRSSIWDLTASYLGVLFFAWVALKIDQARRRSKEAVNLALNPSPQEDGKTSKSP
jgi:hypothetical protein